MSLTIKQDYRKHGVEARLCKALSTRNLKKAFIKAAKKCKNALRRAKFNHVHRIGAMLTSYLANSKSFGSLAKPVESNVLSNKKLCVFFNLFLIREQCPTVR